MKKRGISPLIATVLLIGFAIVLAAVVFKWGGAFLKGQTEEGTKDLETVGPLMGVRVSLENVRIFDDIYNRPKVLVNNEGKTSLDGIVVRVYGDKRVEVQHIDQPLDAFSSGWFEFNIGENMENITRVEVLPKVDVNGEIVISEGSGDSMVLSTAKVISDENVVAYWKFDGDILDDVGGNQCVLVGNTEYITGLFDQALLFDGVGDNIDCGNDLSLEMGTDDLTIEVWAKLNGVQPGDNVGLVGKGAWDNSVAGYVFKYYRNEEKLQLAVSDGDPVGGSGRIHSNSQLGLGLNDSEWHHLAVVFDRDEKTEFFVDGSSVGVSTTLSDAHNGHNIINPGKDLLIGSWTHNDHYLNGTIDEVRISKTVRTF